MMEIEYKWSIGFILLSNLNLVI